jgi:hypothetical protein
MSRILDEKKKDPVLEAPVRYKTENVPGLLDYLGSS